MDPLYIEGPQPPNPPYGGGGGGGGCKVFFGVYNHSDPIESNIVVEIFTSNIISVFLGESLDPQTLYTTRHQ